MLGSALALQFHPEVDHELLELWLADDRDGEVAGVGPTHDELLPAQQNSRRVRLRIRELVRRFLSQVARQPCPSWWASASSTRRMPESVAQRFSLVGTTR